MDLRENETEITRLRKDKLEPISEEQGRILASTLDIETYMECSALTQDGLTDIFEMAARLGSSEQEKLLKNTVAKTQRATFKIRRDRDVSKMSRFQRSQSLKERCLVS